MASNSTKTGFRIEQDSLGKVEVPKDAYYGPQTERSRLNFPISTDRDKMPLPVIRALAMLKEVAASINSKCNRIDAKLTDPIKKACQSIYEGRIDSSEFPLVVWQTGSGTQTNMNVNEVVANLASEAIAGTRDGKPAVHPNDHVNCGQSSNDIFPSAVHVSVALEIAWHVIPALEYLRDSLDVKAKEYNEVIKIGRTHLQDAVPMSVGQELSAYVAQLDLSIEGMKRQLPFVCELAVGGTAVGTGLNAEPGFDREVCLVLTELVQQRASRITKGPHPLVPLHFTPAKNKFAALAAHDTLVQMSGFFNSTATALLKLAQDFALLSSGPGCGFGELVLPANEPGSSIMPVSESPYHSVADYDSAFMRASQQGFIPYWLSRPNGAEYSGLRLDSFDFRGKVNPTQCESLWMVCVQVMANNFAVSLAGSKGILELNVYKPVIASNLLHSCRLLTDSSYNFADRCVNGMTLNRKRIDAYLEQSLMLVTALAPHIGYDKAAQIAKHASKEGLTLRQAAVALKAIGEEDFDKCVNPSQMAFPHGRQCS